MLRILRVKKSYKRIGLDIDNTIINKTAWVAVTFDSHRSLWAALIFLQTVIQLPCGIRAGRLLCDLRPAVISCRPIMLASIFS